MYDAKIVERGRAGDDCGPAQPARLGLGSPVHEVDFVEVGACLGAGLLAVADVIIAVISDEAGGISDEAFDETLAVDIMGLAQRYEFGRQGEFDDEAGLGFSTHDDLRVWVGDEVSAVCPSL